MVITLTVANESNKDFSYHGQDRYFLSQGKTIESAIRRNRAGIIEISKEMFDKIIEHKCR